MCLSLLGWTVSNLLLRSGRVGAVTYGLCLRCCRCHSGDADEDFSEVAVGSKAHGGLAQGLTAYPRGQRAKHSAEVQAGVKAHVMLAGAVCVNGVQ